MWRSYSHCLKRSVFRAKLNQPTCLQLRRFHRVHVQSRSQMHVRQRSRTDTNTGSSVHYRQSIRTMMNPLLVPLTMMRRPRPRSSPSPTLIPLRPNSPLSTPIIHEIPKTTPNTLLLRIAPPHLHPHLHPDPSLRRLLIPLLLPPATPSSNPTEQATKRSPRNSCAWPRSSKPTRSPSPILSNAIACSSKRPPLISARTSTS